MFILAAYVDEKILGNCSLTVKTVEQELLILPEHLSSPSVFSGVRFVLLYFFFWPLCCLFFFDILILITTLVSTNYS